MKCLICNYNFKLLANYNKHLYLHRTSRSAIFKCFWPKCEKVFSKYKTYKIHYFRHKSVSTNIISLSKNQLLEIRKCKVKDCPFETTSLKEIVAHVSDHLICNGQISCPFKNCKSSFINKSSFRCHVFRLIYSVKYI